LPHVDAPPASRTAPTVLALDLGATHIRTAIVGSDGRLGARDRSRTGAEDGAQPVLERCLSSLRSTLEQHRHTGGSRPSALGISAPGPLDPLRGVLHDPPNLGRALWDLPLVERLSGALGLPATMERDTNVAILGERGFGAGIGCDDLVYLTVSTGIGGAVISDGALLRGPDGVAGELGHITVDMNGPLCGCGAPGHLERLASGSGMARSAIEALAANPGAAPELARIAASIAPSALEAHHVSAAATAGDPTARTIVETAIRAFAAAAVSIVDVFNPARIIVGGGIALAWGEALLGPARELVARTGFRVARSRVSIVPAQLGDDVGLIGALPLVRLALLRGGPEPHPEHIAAGTLAAT
jgi:glucokinase